MITHIRLIIIVLCFIYFASGLMFHLPFLDVCQIVDIRLKMLKIPPHAVSPQPSKLQKSHQDFLYVEITFCALKS